LLKVIIRLVTFISVLLPRAHETKQTGVS